MACFLLQVCTCCVHMLAGYSSQPPVQPVQAPPYSQQQGVHPQQMNPAGAFDQGARFDPNKPVTIPVSQLP